MRTPFVVAVAALTCACVDTTLRPDAGVGDGCLVNSDCAEPLICVFRRCHNACLSDRDCPAGSSCRNVDKPLNVCLGAADLACPDGRDRECPGTMICGPDLLCRDPCKSSRDCLADQVCTEGVCASRPELTDAGTLPGAGDAGTPVECWYTSNCPDPLVCRAGACVRECLGDRDCAAGTTCEPDGGVCVRPPVIAVPRDGGVPFAGYGDPCVVTSDCQGSLTCIGNRCGVECLDARDCTAGYQECCRDYRCARGLACEPRDAGTWDGGLPDGGCRSDADCQDALRCNGAERCVDRQCTGAVRSFCDDGNPCTAELCFETGAPACVYQSVLADADGDGHYPLACGGAADDCDDADPDTYPGARERCDLKDNDCNLAVDEGLWHPQPGSRGPVSTGGLYPPGAGRPFAAAAGGQVVVVAASDQVRGQLDAWALDRVTLSPTLGPVALGGSTTQWSSCTPSGTQTWGRRVFLPTLAQNGASLFAAGFEYSWAGAGCCTVSPVTYPTQSSFFRLFDASLGRGDGGTLYTGTRQYYACGSTQHELWYDLTTVPAAAWSTALGKWVLAWADVHELPGVPNNGDNALVYVATLDPAGALSTPRLVYPFNAVQPPSELGNYGGGPVSLGRGGGVVTAVGANTVLVVWTNAPNSTFGLQTRIRYALFDPQLTTVLHGPFDLPWSSPYSPMPLEVEWTGTEYLVLVTALASVPPTLISLDQQGQTGWTRELPSPSPRQYSTWTAISASHQTDVATVDAGLFFALSRGTTGERLTFGWGSWDADAGYQLTDLDLGLDDEQHSDFALVPLDARHVAVFWQDGDLQKLMMECGP